MINRNQELKYSQPKVCVEDTPGVAKFKLEVSRVKRQKKDTPGVARFKAEKAALQREIHVIQEDSDNSLARINALFDELKKQYNL